MRSMSVSLMGARERSGALLVDRVAGGETLEREGLVELVRLVIGDRVSEDPARGRRRLEAAIAPAAVDVEILQRRLADDRAAIHRHVHDAGPMAQHAQAAEAREEREERRREQADRRQIAALGIGVVEIEIAAEDQLALVGLADIDMRRPR